MSFTAATTALLNLSALVSSSHFKAVGIADFTKIGAPVSSNAVVSFLEEVAYLSLEVC